MDCVIVGTLVRHETESGSRDMGCEIVITHNSSVIYGHTALFVCNPLRYAPLRLLDPTKQLAELFIGIAHFECGEMLVSAKRNHSE